MTTVVDKSGGAMSPEELESIRSSVHTLYSNYKYDGFRPAARYHSELDIIRVLVEDVPYVEYRFSEDLTVYVPANESRHSDDEEVLKRPIGFALKGMATLGSVDDAQKLCRKLDDLAQKEGNSFIRSYIRRLLEPMVGHVEFISSHAQQDGPRAH